MYEFLKKIHQYITHKPLQKKEDILPSIRVNEYVTNCKECISLDPQMCDACIIRDAKKYFSGHGIEKISDIDRAEQSDNEK